jgi:paraquat-inducible protein A
MENYIACHDCDLLQRVGRLPAETTAVCRRCGAVLRRRRGDSLERTLALVTAALVLFVLANSFPFLEFKLEARTRETTLITGVLELYRQGMRPVAVLVFLTTVLVPLLQLLGLLYVLLPLRVGRLAPFTMKVFRRVRQLAPWSMMEVFMLGILVSIVKLAKMAKIVPGISVFSFLLLIFVLAAAMSSLDPHAIWEKWKLHSAPNNR